MSKRNEDNVKETPETVEGYSVMNEVYTQRALTSVLLAKIALRLGYTAGVGQDSEQKDAPEWANVLYVDLPEGQISWHFSPTDVHMLEGLPEYKGEWDGTWNSKDIEFPSRVEI